MKRRLAALAIVLLGTLFLGAAPLCWAQDAQRRSGAAEPQRDRAPRQSAVLPGLAPAESRGLAFPLRTTGGPVRIEADLRLDGKVIMSEQQVASADARVVHLFADGAGHFSALRDQDASNPGRVQLRILQDGKPVVDSSLTEFDAKYTTDRATSGGPASLAKSDPQECANDCDSQYEQCTSGCSVYACIEECQYYRNQCMTYCPNCDAWVEVNRTLIGRDWTGSTNYFGVGYCHYREHYLVEQTNPAGCHPNRTVCDFDDDTIFVSFNWGDPDESDCCQEEDPEHFCGGDTTTCN
jgi:hypothetical protein